MPLNINKIMSSSIDQLKFNNIKKIDIKSNFNTSTSNIIGIEKSSIIDTFPNFDLNKFNNLNIDTNKLFSNLNLTSKLGVDNTQLKNDFLKIENKGLKFTNIDDLKKMDLSKLDLSKDFLSNLNKIQSNGIDIKHLSDSLSKLGNISGIDKLLNISGSNNLDLLSNNNLKDKLSNFFNKEDKNKIQIDSVKLPKPGEILTLNIKEDQLSKLEKLLKKDDFSKLSGDDYKSVTNLISADSNINTESGFIGKYILVYVTGQKGSSWDISKNDAIAKINIDQSKISLSADYNKNVDGVIHHIRIALLKNIVPPKVDSKNEENSTTVTKIEKNLYIDRERGIKILVPSQYVDVYQTSKWGGYPSFSTTKFSRQMVWYDNSYDRPDYYPTNITKPATKNRDGRSNFDINVHIGQPGGKSVGNWSDDGSHCFENADAIKEFFEICNKHIEIHGNKFTYTLATKDDYDKAYRDDQIAKEERRKKAEEEAKQRALLLEQQKQQNTSTNTSTTNNTSDLSVSTPANTNKEADKPKSTCPNYDCWSHYGKEKFWNGVNTIGGKKVPAIVIEKSNSYFKISYKGSAMGFLLKHAKGGTGDTIHQLLNVLTLELNPYMLSNKLKPDVDNIQMYLKSNSLVVGVPLMKSPSGIAYTIKRRGGLNHYGDTSDLKPFAKRKDYKYKMVVSGSSGWKLTEHFITFEGPE